MTGEHGRARPVDIRLRCPIDDLAVSRLHARAFGGEPAVVAWGERLARHSRSWVCAFGGDELVGFVHAVWDGGIHAFLLDTVVDPDHQRQGVGRLMVQALLGDLKDRGISWVHVDFEPDYLDFYLSACGFGATSAGLLDLTR